MLNSRAELAPGAFVPSTPVTLARAIENLLHLLANPSLENPTASEPQIQSWEDDEYSYIEIPIRNSDLAICDISIAEGKVFIRTVKLEMTDDDGERLPRLATIDPNEPPPAARRG